MHKEEIEIFEKESSDLKFKKETEDYRKKILEDPLWKRVLKRTGKEIGEEVKRWVKASKPKPQRKTKPKTELKKKKTKSKPKDKTITIKVS